MSLSGKEQSKRMTLAWIEVERPLYAYIASMVSSHADADDVLQAVAVAMIDRFETYDPTRPLLGWALGIARHKVTDFLRARSGDKYVLGDEVLGMIEDAYEKVSRQADDLRDALAECMLKTTGRQRHALELRYQDDLKPAAIGKQMGASSAVISNLLKRARATLRRCIQQRIANIPLDGDA